MSLQLCSDTTEFQNVQAKLNDGRLTVHFFSFSSYKLLVIVSFFMLMLILLLKVSIDLVLYMRMDKLPRLQHFLCCVGLRGGGGKQVRLLEWKCVF